MKKISADLPHLPQHFGLETTASKEIKEEILRTRSPVFKLDRKLSLKKNNFRVIDFLFDVYLKNPNAPIDEKLQETEVTR